MRFSSHILNHCVTQSIRVRFISDDECTRLPAVAESARVSVSLGRPKIRPRIPLTGPNLLLKLLSLLYGHLIVNLNYICN